MIDVMKRLGNFASQKLRLKQMQLAILFGDLKQMKNNIMKDYEKKKYDYAMEFLEKGGYLPNYCHHTAKKNLEDENCKEFQNAECEICLDSLTAKAIYACKRCDNLMCERCAKTVRCCPFCRIRAPNFAERNSAVERFIASLTLPCRYQRHGCKALVNRNSRELHEKYCMFAPVYCPFFRLCGFSGDLEALHLHLFKSHNTTLVLDDDFDVYIKSLWSKLKLTADKKKSNAVMLYCYDHMFICKITLYKDNLHFTFKQARTTKNEVLDAKKFGFFLEVSSPSRCVKGIIPFTNGRKIEEFEFSPKLILDEDKDKDHIHVYLSIKCLDDMLK